MKEIEGGKGDKITELTSKNFDWHRFFKCFVLG